MAAAAAGIRWALSQFLQLLGGPGRGGGPAFRRPRHRPPTTHGNATVFASSRVSRCSRDHGSAARGQQWTGQRALGSRVHPAPPCVTPLLTPSSRGWEQGWLVATEARPMWSARGPRAWCPRRDSVAHISGTWPPSGSGPRSLEAASPWGPALLQPTPHGLLPTTVQRASPLLTLAASGTHELPGPGSTVATALALLAGQQTNVATVGMPRTSPEGDVGVAAQAPDLLLLTLPNTCGVRGGPGPEACQPSNQDPGYKETGSSALPVGTERPPRWTSRPPPDTLPGAHGHSGGWRLEGALWRPWALHVPSTSGASGAAQSGVGGGQAESCPL